jgi:GYF domain 2
MGIRFLCPNGHKLNVKADLAGKRASCPECGAKLVVPGASPKPAIAPTATVVGSATPAGGVWYMQSSDGQQFGPATEPQFCEWIAAGRVTAESHVWRDGWPEWKVARDAAELLPMPLAAVPVAAASVAATPAAEPPSAPATPPEPAIATAAEPDAEPAAAPVVADSVIDENVVPTAATYALRKQRRKKTQMTLAMVMLLAVIVLAGILIWVIVSSSSETPPVSQQNSTAHESERM